MALWSAHMGGYDEDFLEPNSVECLNKVKSLTKIAQALYIQDPMNDNEEENNERNILLIAYPIKIPNDGKLKH